MSSSAAHPRARRQRPSLPNPAVAIACLVGIVAIAAGCAGPTASAAPITLRLQVSLTPEELAAYKPAVEALDAAHPEWIIQLETVPQESEVEKITSELTGGLPDVLRVTGLNAQQWIRRDAFLDLEPRIAAAKLDLADFYAGPLEQFRWNGKLYGLPDSATPEVVYYNKAMFDAADLAYPDDTWTYDDMRAAAIQLTLDDAGRHPGDPGFDPDTIRQWGWNGGLTYFWQNEFVRALGGDLCANEDCTEMSFTDPATAEAIDWWVRLVRDDHAALYDPYGGSQTGVPGDPFQSGAAAMGSNGYFAVGQLNTAGTIDYDIIPPLLGTDGQRHTPLSTNGYVIGGTTTHADAAWALVQALVEPAFLETTWGKPGNAVPSRISAADSAVDTSHAPANQAAVLEAMEVGRVFRPFTASAFAAFGATAELFTKLNTGAIGLDEGLAQLEQAANDALAPDRAP